MKIAFNKINFAKYPFKFDLDNVVFDGYISKIEPKIAKIKASMKGFAYRPCDRCADEVEIRLDEYIEVLASDGIFKDEANQLSNVIEFFDSQIDLFEVALSEFEATLSDYFYCNKCKGE